MSLKTAERRRQNNGGISREHTHLFLFQTNETPVLNWTELTCGSSGGSLLKANPAICPFAGQCEEPEKAEKSYANSKSISATFAPLFTAYIYGISGALSLTLYK